MPPLENLYGQVFGRLTVLGRAPNKENDTKVYWRCRCSCEKQTILDVPAAYLKSGHTKSCGCLRSENTSKFNTETKTVHGMRSSVLYSRWASMKRRVNREYKDYPERYVCDEWRISFEVFADWALKNGFDPSLSLDRINNDGPYSPENCRWVDNKTQCNNKGNNHLIEYNSKQYTISQFSDYTGIKSSTIRTRLNNGWTPEDIVNRPVVDNTHYIEYEGSNYNMKDWGFATGIGDLLIHNRLQRGWDEIKAITTPPLNGLMNAIYFVDINGKPLRDYDYSV